MKVAHREIVALPESASLALAAVLNATAARPAGKQVRSLIAMPMSARRYLGGVLLNTRENMVRWLMNPQAIDPRSGMPNLHVRQQHARDIAAYL